MIGQYPNTCGHPVTYGQYRGTDGKYQCIPCGMKLLRDEYASLPWHGKLARRYESLRVQLRDGIREQQTRNRDAWDVFRGNASVDR